VCIVLRCRRLKFRYLLLEYRLIGDSISTFFGKFRKYWCGGGNNSSDMWENSLEYGDKPGWHVGAFTLKLLRSGSVIGARQPQQPSQQVYCKL